MNGGPGLEGLTAAAAGAAALVALAGTGIVRAFMARARVLAYPNERSSHSVPTPSAGGLGSVAAVAAVLPVAAVLAGRPELGWALVPLVAVAAVGLADDLRPVPASRKMVLMILAGCVALALGRADWIHLPYTDPFRLGVLAVPLSVFWLAAFPNAFNFMDGIDGIAGITALVSGAVYAFAGVVADDPDTALLGAVTAGAAAGFLPWNFPRARIFMGDSGSLPLGLLLALTALVAGRPGGLHGVPTVDFPASVLLLGPFVFDVTFTLVRRAVRRAPLGEAHREHLYQRLTRAVGGHARVSLLYGSLSLATGLLALVYGEVGDLGKLLSLTLPLVAMLGFAGWVLRLEGGRPEGSRESA